MATGTARVDVPVWEKRTVRAHIVGIATRMLMIVMSEMPSIHTCLVLAVMPRHSPDRLKRQQHQQKDGEPTTHGAGV